VELQGKAPHLKAAMSVVEAASNARARLDRTYVDGYAPC
jgi:hypothetical protein